MNSKEGRIGKGGYVVISNSPSPFGQYETGPSAAVRILSSGELSYFFEISESPAFRDFNSPQCQPLRVRHQPTRYKLYKVTHNATQNSSMKTLNQANTSYRARASGHRGPKFTGQMITLSGPSQHPHMRAPKTSCIDSSRITSRPVKSEGLRGHLLESPSPSRQTTLR